MFPHLTPLFDIPYNLFDVEGGYVLEDPLKKLSEFMFAHVHGFIQFFSHLNQVYFNQSVTFYIKAALFQ